ncbi:uncharacterized protein LOC120268633 [Dioscorea cayenensis subsp. rotundata]|uniref:Uncharacterized protein LOC120268633 n=1 Tax=Dioscorea cayennensis subsp. rotundata TaxID=55577 RepID=A0AB40BWT2_DIOCR|nr:uncharacterized protein LOC120268633 [Dioscorea cayenensis subsp. rotundata]
MAYMRQKGLEEAICRVYPSVEHRTCVRHMYKNFKKKFRGESLQRSVWVAARSYTVRGYNTAIEDIKSINIRAYNWIEDLGKKPEIWSRSQFSTVCKCDYITNNISESFNAWVAEARERPVLDLLDTIRQKIMVTMDKRRRMATKWKDDIVPSVKKYVRNLSRGLAAYEVQRCSDSKAEVSYKGQRCEVLLADGICSCRKWQVSGIPCVHAMAFIFSIRGAKWEEYVDLYFSVEKTRVAYNLEIAPMPDINQWTCNGQLDGLLPPLSRRPAGRPKKNRIRAADEIKSGRHKCARCGGFGHQARTCKEPNIQQIHQQVVPKEVL